MKKYQPIITETQRTELLNLLRGTGRPDLEDAIRSAPEHRIGQRIKDIYNNLHGRIAGTAWEVHTDMGAHTFVREGEFEILPEPEGADLIGKLVKIREYCGSSESRLKSLNYTDDRGNGGQRWMRTWGLAGTVIEFRIPEEGEFANPYKIILDGGTWGWFARGEFDVVPDSWNRNDLID